MVCSAKESSDQAKTGKCHCGKYKKIRYKGVICDRCGVEVTKSSVRRERMGHIELAAPVSHIWYFKGIPSRMGLMLDLSPRVLEKVLYFANYIVLDKGTSELQYKQVLTEREFQEARENTYDIPCRHGCRSCQRASGSHRHGKRIRRAEKRIKRSYRTENVQESSRDWKL